MRRYIWITVLAVNFGVLLYQIRGSSVPTPSGPSGINWSPCGDNIECGRLTAPLDYHNLSSGATNLAVARYRATNTTARLGTIFTNPGGPGGSGLRFIYSEGARLAATLDGRYDIVTWDPRGINNTTPRIECFNSQTDQDLYYFHIIQETGLEFRNGSDPVDMTVFAAQIRQEDARNAALVQRCHETSGELLKYVGTTTVARDLEYLSRVIEGEHALVNYWGFSYGTTIGSYFLNMFPTRVGRVILDGSGDPTVWSSVRSVKWQKFFYRDADKTFENFVVACQEAGPTRCALATENSTAKSIASEIDKLLSDLYSYPLPVPHARRPGILTSGILRARLLNGMYGPRGWPELAKDLVAAITGDGTALLNKAQRNIETDRSIKPETVQANPAVIYALQENTDEILIAYEKTSKRFIPVDLDVCHHWKTRPAERFTGPFNHSLSNPILIIGNTADPVIPLAESKAVRKLYANDSRLLLQDTSGHCSVAMASLCTGRAIREYFFDGKLPLDNTLCAASEIPFPPKNSENTFSWISGGIMNEEDMRILQNFKKLGEEMQPLLTFRRGY
ncbi:hypothetical protein M422DRAFT_774620 [Sphaerobolus stellatus SS14]|nr:hypothetical protein M422DRAFT_774620 [Sphaerobolus stellatus SS14]